jgi:hypothetical protein
MAFRSPDLTNLIGTRLVPFTNPRVVAPPGVPGFHDRPNLVVATPMRSGTHVLIDLILNNLPAYRNRPLYVDLDQCLKQARPGRDLLGAVRPRSGYVLKTHYPVGVPAAAADPRFEALVEDAVVLVVHRERADILASLATWLGTGVDPETRFGPQIDAFRDFWAPRPRLDIAFADLFRAAPSEALLDRIADLTGTRRGPRLVPPPPRDARWRIPLDKAATRLLGHRAPRINTTIHTLKS